MQFGSDDDGDFTLFPGSVRSSSKSKLGSLFEKSTEKQPPSVLTYTAPKQPKKNESKTSNTASSGKESNQMSVLYAVPVNAFKFEDGTYAPKGKVGAAILGCPEAMAYQLLLYKGNQDHVAIVKITPLFQFTVQSNNYANFYDNQRHNWSIMFQSAKDVTEFTKQFILAKAKSYGDNFSSVIIQDMYCGDGKTIADPGTTVQVKYTGWIADGVKVGEMFEENKSVEFKVGKENVLQGIYDGVKNASNNTRRLLVVPPALGYKNQSHGSIPPNSTLILDLHLKICTSSTTETLQPLFTLPDNADDSSIKARTASLSEALTSSPKSDKASIISRMARMGQATFLPSVAKLSTSDVSENEEEDNPVTSTPKPADMLPPKPIKPSELPKPITMPLQPIMPPQTMMSFVPPWQQQPYPMYQSPMTTPVVTPVNNPNLESQMNLILSETRSQNTEVRIAIGRVTDRMDQVMSKLSQVEQLQHQQQYMYNNNQQQYGYRPVLPQTHNVQDFAVENMQLKSTVSKQEQEIQQLTEQLKDQNSSLNEMEALRCQLEEISKVVFNLKEQINDSQLRNKTLENGLEDEKLEVERLTKSYEDSEEKLRELKHLYHSSSKELENTIQTLNQEKSKLEEDLKLNEKTLSECNEQIRNNKSSEINNGKEIIEKIQCDNMKLVQELEAVVQEKKILQENIRSSQDTKSVEMQVKRIMNIMFGRLSAEFDSDEHYTAENIKETLIATIRNVTLQFLEESQSKESGKAQAFNKTVIEANHHSTSHDAETSLNEDVEDSVDSTETKMEPPTPPVFDPDDDTVWLD